MKNFLFLRLICLTFISFNFNAFADTRYSEICVSTSTSNLFYNYSNLYLSNSYIRDDHRNPVRYVTTFDMTNSSFSKNDALSRLETGELDIYELSKFGQRILYYNKRPIGGEITINATLNQATIESESARLTVIFNQKTILSIPLINIERGDQPVRLQQKDMIFNGEKVQAVTYQYCGQGAD